MLIVDRHHNSIARYSTISKTPALQKKIASMSMSWDKKGRYIAKTTSTASTSSIDRKAAKDNVLRAAYCNRIITEGFTNLPLSQYWLSREHEALAVHVDQRSRSVFGSAMWESHQGKQNEILRSKTLPRYAECSLG